MKDLTIPLSTVDYSMHSTGIVIKQNDFGTYSFVFEGLNASDYTSGVIKFYRTGDNSIVADDVTIADDTITYALVNESISVAGKVEVEISLYKDGSRLTTNTFSFRVIDDIDTDGAVHADDRLPILDAKIVEVETLHTQAEQIINDAEIGLAGKENTGTARSIMDSHESKLDPHTQYQQKEVGKGLSSNDYTTTEKNKLAGLTNTTIINDLTTGGESAALSAEQGKILQSTKADLIGGDFIKVANYAALPITGETGRVYITLNNSLQYKWTGTAYIEINLINDQTFEATWKPYTVSYNTVTKVFTTSAPHDLSATLAVEFAGVLPTGLLPYNSDKIGGTYYNIIDVTTNTFRITETVGSTTEFQPTTSADNFQIRLAGMTSFVLTGLNLNSDKCYRIEFSDFGFAKKTVAGVSSFFRLNNATTYSYLGSYGGGGYNVNAATIFNNQTKKYQMSMMSFNLSYVSSDTLSCMAICGGTSSDNKIADTAIPVTVGYLVKNVTANITSIQFSCSNQAIGIIRNGVRVRVWRV